MNDIREFEFQSEVNANEPCELSMEEVLAVAGGPQLMNDDN